MKYARYSLRLLIGLLFVGLISCEPEFDEVEKTPTANVKGTSNYNVKSFDKEHTRERLHSILVDMKSFPLSGEDPFNIDWGYIDENRSTQVRVDSITYVAYKINTYQKDERFFINLIETRLGEDLVGLHYQGYILGKEFYYQYTEEGAHITNFSGYTIKEGIIHNESNCAQFLIYPVSQPSEGDGESNNWPSGDPSGYLPSISAGEGFYGTISGTTSGYWGGGGSTSPPGSNGESGVVSFIEAVGDTLSEGAEAVGDALRSAWRWLRNLYCGSCYKRPVPEVTFPEDGLLIVHPSLNDPEIEKPNSCRELTLGVINNNFSIKYISTIMGIPEDDVYFLLEPENMEFFAKCLVFLEDGEYRNSALDNFRKALASYKDTANSPTVEEKLIDSWIDQAITDRAEIMSFLNDHVTNGVYDDEALAFALQAIQFISENPEITFSEYENWFIRKQTETEIDLGIDPELITYDSPLTQQNLPTMDDFVMNFPKYGTSGNYEMMPTTDVYELVGGSLWTSHQNNPNAYSNACSIRGSRGLLYSGIDIPVLNYPGVGQRTQKGGDQKNYILDAVSFDKYMRDKFGPPTYELTGADANDPTKVANMLKGKNGIYVIINSSHQQATYSGHVDAIIDGECISGAYTTPQGGVKSIAIWELD